MRGNKEEGGAERAASGGEKAKEDDASTAPLPEKVCICCNYFISGATCSCGATM